MASFDPKPLTPESSRLPDQVLAAFERFRAHGDAQAVEALVVAAVVDYRPSSSGSAPKELAPDIRLIEDLGYDSVAVAELVFFLEDLFDVTISNGDLQGTRTMDELRSCVLRKLSEKTTTA